MDLDGKGSSTRYVESVKNQTTADVQRYYESSDDELARRYIKDERFLSVEYCRAALDHRYGLYPFIPEFVGFDAWAGKRVLEVGCGQGADLSQFALAGAYTCGCDLTHKHCRISRDFVGALGARASIAQADARALPYPSNAFDLVYAFGVLLLIDDLEAAVAELYRVLKPGGTVVTMFYNRQSLHYYIKTLYYYGIVCDLEQLLGPRRLVDWFTDGFGYPRTHHQTPESLREVFARFSVDRVVVRNLTPDQLPRFPCDEYPPAFWSWLASRLGFNLMLKARK
jgi:ubiquinone/menaquinone biosynthesis C-methylase UbiE